MDILGNLNLFSNHFVIGCCESSLLHTKTLTNEIISFHKWNDFIRTDYAMDKFIDRVQYIDYPHIISLDNVKQIKIDLYNIYIKSYPYSSYEDFIKSVFEYTIYDLKNFIDFDFTWTGTPPNINDYEYFYFFERGTNEFLFYGLLSEFDDKHYKQYYKRVIDILETPIDIDLSENQINDIDKTQIVNNKFIYPQFNETPFIDENNSNIIETTESISLSPFVDEKSKKLFQFIVNNWSNTNTNKWGYIWEFFNTKGNGKLTYKVEYEEFLIKNKFLIKGKINYESCNSNKHYQKLEELLTQFNISEI